MKISQGAYVPALKWRQAEYQALLRLSDAAKGRVVPLIIIPPVEFDFEEAEPKKTPQEYLEPFPRRFKLKWGARAAWIDVDPTLHSAVMSDGSDGISFVFSELRKFNANAVPVVSLDFSSIALATIASIAKQDQRGVALRARLAHVMRPTFSADVARVLGELNIIDSNVDLIIDLGAPTYEPYDIFSKALAAALQRLPLVNLAASFILIGTAFPESLKDIELPGGEIIRHHWAFYKKLIADLPTNFRRPNFGDYTVVNPAFTAAFDFRKVKPAGKLVYTANDRWQIRKGGAFRDNRAQMHGHCAHILKSGYFQGPLFSNGDDFIEKCATKKTGPSTQTKWKEVGISHHIMHVLADLASSAATT